MGTRTLGRSISCIILTQQLSDSIRVGEFATSLSRDQRLATDKARYPRLRIDRGPAMLEVAFWETTAADARSSELVR